MYKKVALLAAITIPALATSAYAIDETANFTVTAQITADCTISTPANVDFGTLATLTGAGVAASTSVNITCSNGTPYTVGVNNGLTNLRRLMPTTLGGGALPTDYITYQVNQTSNIAAPVTFANLGTSVLGNTGDGVTVHTYPIWVALPSQVAPTPDIYTDTLTVGVRY